MITGIGISINKWSTRKKILALILITLVIHIAMLAIDALWVSQSPLFGEHTYIKCDLSRYIGRAETILQGGLLYRDFHTETPPLINYIFLIPTAISPSAISFEIFLSLFNVFTVLLLFYALKNVDEKIAFLSALLYSFLPFALNSAIFEVQDEPIVAFFFLLPIVLMRFGKRNLAATMIGMGIWIKAFPLLLLPILIFEDKNNKERLLHLVLIGVISLLITLPYLILCPDEFIQFLRYYIFGKNGIEGISYWRFLIYEFMGNLGIASLAVLLAGMGATYFWILKSKKSVWISCLIVVLAFFILYRKIHWNYYLYPLALLAPFHFMDKGIRWRIWAVVALVLCTQPFASHGRAEIMPMIPIALSLGTLVMLASIAARIAKLDIPDQPTISSIS